MATPLCSLCRNVGWWRLVLVVAMLAVGFGGKAQVTNDDCLSAYSLNVGPGSFLCEGFGLPEDGTLITGTTAMAIPNYPYPANPNACSGYSPVVVAPGNDVWYRFNFVGGLGLQIWATDTIHVSLWTGSDCSSLTPLACYTVASGGIVSDNTFETYSLNGAYVQVVDPSGLAASFELCVTNPYPPSSNSYYTDSLPTPVICFGHAAQITSATSPGSFDGSVEILIQGSTPPYTIQWTDGDTTMQRQGLQSGVYTYAITDGVGCTLSDSAVVGFLVSTGILTPLDMHLAISTAEGSVVLNFPSAAPIEGRIIDILGRGIMEWKRPRSNTLGFAGLVSGLYVIQIRDATTYIQARPIKIWIP